jgi:hypothetical protein
MYHMYLASVFLRKLVLYVIRKGQFLALVNVSGAQMQGLQNQFGRDRDRKIKSEFTSS